MSTGRLRTTYTYATLEVSHEAYQEIKDKLSGAGYEDQFHEEGPDGILIDMHGIALKDERIPPPKIQHDGAVGLYRFFNIAAAKYGEPMRLCAKCAKEQAVPATCVLDKLADNAVGDCQGANQ